MTRRLIGLIIAISISFTVASQKKDICFSDSVVGQMIDELIVKDHLQFTVNKLDSTVTVYKNTVAEQKQEIVKLKLNESNYELVVAKLNAIIASKDQELREGKANKVKSKVIAFFKGVVTGVIIVVTYVILNKHD